MKIIGFDISTTTIGWCIIKKETNEFIDAGYINLNKIKNLYEKTCMAIYEIGKIMSLHKIEEANVEDFLSNFRYGFSNLKTIILLASFNSLISYELRKNFNLKVNRVNVTQARKNVGFSMNKQMRILKKESGDKNFVKHQIANLCLLQEEKLRDMYIKNKSPRKEFYDIIDAYVIAKYNLLDEGKK